MILPTAALCALACFPFFIVNLVRYGDPLGMHAFYEGYLWRCEQYYVGQPLMVPYTEGLAKLLLKSTFVEWLLSSFVGEFGYMWSVVPALFRYLVETALLLGMGASLVPGEKGHRSERDGLWRMLWWSLVAASLITIAACVWRSLTTDFQPQGRYIIVVLAPLWLASMLGWWRVFERLPRWLPYVLAACYVAVGIVSFLAVFRIYGWQGAFVGADAFLAVVIP